MATFKDLLITCSNDQYERNYLQDYQHTGQYGIYRQHHTIAVDPIRAAQSCKQKPLVHFQNVQTYEEERDRKVWYRIN